MATYEVKCDECKVTIRTTADARTSCAGGLCAECRTKRNAGLRYKPILFSSVELACSFADRCEKPMRVVLGDHPRIWVVRPSDAARLERVGYEIVA